MYDLKMPYFRALDSQVRGVLRPLLRGGHFKGRTVALDFDHSCIANDIGEACFETLVKTETLTRASLPTELETVLNVPVSDNLVDFYADFAAGASDRLAATQALYVWLAQIHQGLSPWDIVRSTELTLARSHVRCRFPRPFAHPEMIELLGMLIGGGADIWIVSASNPWSVRVAVERLINPFLRKQRYLPISADRVVGLSTGLFDRFGCSFSDLDLVRADSEYRALEPGRLSEFTLGSRISLPAPVFDGKAQVCQDVLPSLPLLAVGDSENDLAMLAQAELKLWIARPEKDELLSTIRAKARAETGWMIQYVDPTPDGQLLG